MSATVTRSITARSLAAALLAVSLLSGGSGIFGATSAAAAVQPVTARLALRAHGAADARPTDASVAFWQAIIRMAMFSGESAWVDVFDWSPSVIGRPAPFGPAQVDEIARRGAQVLFIQTSRWNRSEDVADPALLRAIIASAHARGMRVVGWYLPTFVDMATDVRRFGAMRAAGVDGIAVDIEDTTVDAPTRSQRLVFESFLLRWWLPGTPMGAVTLPNVVTDVISPGYWPGFPWRQIAGFYDVWLPMSYWTNRTVASGYRDAYRYTSENIDRLRNALGNANAPVVPVGGIADHTTAADVTGFVRAATERRAIGGGLYDVRTTAPALWSPLLSFRR